MRELAEDILAHRAWLLSFIDVSSGDTVVDLGCGRGDDLLALARASPDVPVTLLGLDASEASLEAARFRAEGDPRVRFQNHNFSEALPLKDASVDVVYSNNLLECLGDLEAFAAEVARVLRPDGQLVVGHWDWDSQAFDAQDKLAIRRIVHAFSDWQQSWMEHADGWMGRRLWGVFNARHTFAGTTYGRTLINTEYSDPWFGYSIAQSFSSLRKRGLVSAEDLDYFEQEQLRLHREGRYFYSLTGYAYVGRRQPT